MKIEEAPDGSLVLRVGKAPDRHPLAQWLMADLFPEVVADEADAAADAVEMIQRVQRTELR